MISIDSRGAWIQYTNIGTARPINPSVLQLVWYVCICVNMCVYVCIYAYMCVCVWICVHMCVYVRICVHMCVYVCICAYMCDTCGRLVGGGVTHAADWWAGVWHVRQIGGGRCDTCGRLVGLMCDTCGRLVCLYVCISVYMCVYAYIKGFAWILMDFHDFHWFQRGLDTI